MTELVSWIKNIAIFYIVAALILQLIPGKEYHKYIRVFIGMITIILIVNPLSRILGNKEDLSEYFKSNYNLQMEDELIAELEIMGELREKAILEDYILPVQNNIKKYTDSIGVKYIDSTITVETDERSEDFGKITNIELMVQCDYTQADELIEIEIKNYLVNFYNLEKRNINVNISNSG